MDAFEGLISEILWRRGYWVRTSLKVNLTKEEKVKIARPSAPRWELDVVAYGGRANELFVVECKSFLDSRGVTWGAVSGKNAKAAYRYKLFIDDTLRSVVLERLRRQLAEAGACRRNAKVVLCLACGRIASEEDRRQLRVHFEARGWKLWDSVWLRERLHEMAEEGYENETSAVVAKLLLRP